MPVLKITRHERFVQNIVNGMGAGPAYTAAGYEAEAHSAASAGGRLLQDAKIKKRIAELNAPAVKATELSVERVLQEMTHLAFYDMTGILKVDKNKITLRDPTSLPEDMRRAIVRITPVQVGKETQYSCKFADKQKALDSLGRHLQMFKDTLVVENVFRVVNEMDDDELDRRLTELERAYGQATALNPASGEGTTRIH